MNEKLLKIHQALGFIEHNASNKKEHRKVTINDIRQYDFDDTNIHNYKNKNKNKIKSYRMQDEFGEKKFIKP